MVKRRRYEDWEKDLLSEGWRPPDKDKEQKAKDWVETVQWDLEGIKAGIDEFELRGADGIEGKARLMCALTAKQKESREAWNEVTRAIEERLARSEATSLDPAGNDGDQAAGVNVDRDEEKAKQWVNKVQAQLQYIKTGIHEYKELERNLSMAFAAKEKESSKAWEEVSRAIAERLARKAPAPSPSSSSASWSACAVPDPRIRAWLEKSHAEAADSDEEEMCEFLAQSGIWRTHLVRDAAADEQGPHAPSSPSSASSSATLQPAPGAFYEMMQDPGEAAGECTDEARRSPSRCRF
jgi:hypothetical protein